MSNKKWGQQPCWTCERSGAKPPIQCCWDKSLTPVPGWVAESVSTSYQNAKFNRQGYKIYECPLYVAMEDERPVKEEVTKVPAKSKKEQLEKKFLLLIQKGLTNKEIAEVLNITVRTVIKWKKADGFK